MTFPPPRSYRQRDVQNPHFRLPFQFGSIRGGAYMNEQDSIEDILDCIKAIMAFPLGSLQTLPDFGLPDILFQHYEGRLPSQIKNAILLWEDRGSIDMQGGMIPEDYCWELLMKVGARSD